MDIIRALEQQQINQDVTPFNVGDTVKVHYRITEGNRERIQVFQGAVIRATAVAWDVEFIGPHDIDELGISACLKAAFSRAVAAIECAGVRIDAILLDGNPLHIDDREVNVVKGDARCAAISCASIIAKVERDAYMRSQAVAYPAYGFEENKGYGSAQHIEAIKKHGLTSLHRASFCRAWTQDSLFG